jgi:signal transduction histidine kinase
MLLNPNRTQPRARAPVAAQSREMTDSKALKKALATELAKDQPNLDRFAELSEKLLVSDPDAVRFSVDAGHIKRLGQELVGKAETALAELIKNAYDADATTCTVTFENADKKKGGTLIVVDNGTGMAEADLREGWMRLSTGKKIEHPLSAFYQRSRAGRKGIGRFAVQRLGTKLVLETKPVGETIGYRVTFDWEGDYPQGASLSQISNQLERFPKQIDDQGTRLIIKNLRDPWDNPAIDRVWRSVLLLQPPFPIYRSPRASGADADPGFSVTINGTSDAQSKLEWSIETKFLDYAIAIISGKIDAAGAATFTLESKRLGVKEAHQPTGRFLTLGELEFKAHYFVFDARAVPGLTVKTITDFARMYGGVRVYRNGFRVPPYGESNDDWLLLAFDTGRRTLLIPANNFNFFGQVMLDVERNVLLEETSGREGLIENEAFAELQAFVRMGLEWGAKRVASIRERKVDPGKTRKPKDAEPPGHPSAALTSVISAVNSMAADSGDVRTAELVEELERVKEAQQAFEQEVEAERDRAIRYEEMLRILASLGMSIAVFGHEIGGALTIVGAEIARLKQEAQTAKAAGLNFAPAEDAVARLADLGRYIVDVMSSAESRELVSVPLHAAITRFVGRFSTYLDKQGVSFETSVEPQYLRTAPIHRSEIDAVLFNLMTNALKAIRRANVANGRIRVSAPRGATILPC